MPCLFYDFEPGERVVLRERDHDRVYGNCRFAEAHAFPEGLTAEVLWVDALRVNGPPRGERDVVIRIGDRHNVMCEERCLLLMGHRGRIEP